MYPFEGRPERPHIQDEISSGLADSHARESMSSRNEFDICSMIRQLLVEILYQQGTLYEHREANGSTGMQELVSRSLVNVVHNVL